MSYMRQKTHIIYIPGLGTSYDPLRRQLLKAWRIYGVSVEFVPMYWTDQESFDIKKQRVIDAVLNAERANRRVVLIGESAGGSMVLNVYGEHTDAIAKVMTICGKNTRVDTLSAFYQQKTPAFYESMRRVRPTTDALSTAARTHFTSFAPFIDPTVPVEETRIPGGGFKRLFAIGHLTTILLALSIFSWQIASFAKKP